MTKGYGAAADRDATGAGGTASSGSVTIAYNALVGGGGDCDGPKARCAYKAGVVAGFVAVLVTGAISFLLAILTSTVANFLEVGVTTTNFFSAAP